MLWRGVSPDSISTQGHPDVEDAGRRIPLTLLAGDQASYAQLEAMVLRLAQTQPIALLEGLSYARGKVAKRRDRHCMRAETYEDREMNAPNGWSRSTSYEKKWRYRWQADREREIIAILEGWEREVKGRAEELMWEGAEGREMGWVSECGYSDPWMRPEIGFTEQYSRIEDAPG